MCIIQDNGQHTQHRRSRSRRRAPRAKQVARPNEASVGHSTVSITPDTYSHAILALQEEAAERIARLVLAEG